MLSFFHSTQTCSTAVRILLEEAEIPHNLVEVSWRRNSNVDMLEKVNPLGTVPTLKIEEKVLSQTAAVLEYLADQVPEKNLLPREGTWERTKAASWFSFVAADFQKSFIALARAQYLTSDLKAQEEIRASSRETISKYLSYIDKALGQNPYLLGKDFSAVDAYLFVVIGWCKWAEVKIAPYPNILPFLKRVEARPAVRKVLAADGLSDFFPA